MLTLLLASCEASVRTRGAQQRSKVHSHAAAFRYMTWWESAKEEPAAPEGTVEAPEQGFEGESVQHVDMDTATGDWRREYGPKGPPHHPAADMKSTAVNVSMFSSVAFFFAVTLV